MNADGSGQTNLTQNPAHDNLPDWSPDGSEIAFETDRDGDFEIYVIGADGSDPFNLSFAFGTDAGPTWSPDGTLIAY